MSENYEDAIASFQDAEAELESRSKKIEALAAQGTDLRAGLEQRVVLENSLAALLSLRHYGWNSKLESHELEALRNLLNKNAGDTRELSADSRIVLGTIWNVLVRKATTWCLSPAAGREGGDCHSRGAVEN